ncbi:MAG: hypothetical protein PHR35_15650 [Kiritimatiellae bacterium]|nr:hypothetical protein [Kiritimatiellia bacterium]
MNAGTKSVAITVAGLMIGAGIGARSGVAAELFKYDGYLTTNATVIASNTALSSVTGLIASRMQGKSVNKPGLGGIYHYSNNGTMAVYQVQREDGTWTKCVKVQMEQSGADITARAIYAKYDATASHPAGFDFDTGGTATVLATNDTVDGYGVKLIYVNKENSTNWPFYIPPHLSSICGGYRLANLANVSAKLGGASILDPDPVAHIYYFTNNGTTASFQAQTVDGVNIKCVKIEMEASGSSLIKARVAYAKYMTGAALGYNFDGGGTIFDSATASADPGYGLYDLGVAIVRRGTAILIN